MCLVFSLEESAKGLSGQTAPFFTDKQENLGYNLGKIFLTKRRDGGIILKKKRLTALLLSVILSVIPAISCLAEGTEPVSEANDLTNQVVIYHTNDMHGALEEGSGKFSIAQTAALKENTEHAFLVDAGDATQGVPLASITKGKDVIRLMNMAGYDAMCLGNHEFDYEQFFDFISSEGIYDSLYEKLAKPFLYAFSDYHQLVFNMKTIYTQVIE